MRRSFRAAASGYGLAPLAVLLISGGAAASVDAPHFLYDVADGVTAHYTGDLTDGTLTLADIADQQYRVQRLWTPPHVEFGSYTGDSVEATMHLVSFVDNTPDGSGDGDEAHFAGTLSGQDLEIYDNDFPGPNKFRASIESFILLDRSADPVLPHFEVQAVLSDVYPGGDRFQGVCAEHIQETATLTMCIAAVDQTSGESITLEEFLSNSDLGDYVVKADTLDLWVGGDTCWGDFNSDGMIGQWDLAVVLGEYGRSAYGDLNGDGETGQFDLAVILANFGEVCP
ncbi:MAG: hypothetical protein ACF8NJ_06840 [Phycisphaerales bacterium JB038]